MYNTMGFKMSALALKHDKGSHLSVSNSYPGYASGRFSTRGRGIPAASSNFSRDIDELADDLLNIFVSDEDDLPDVLAGTHD